MLKLQLEHWRAYQDTSGEVFWAWLGNFDNAAHFKSGRMINFCTHLPAKVDFIKHLRVDFGCPGHGKGPWDGIGAVLKQTISRDITNGNILTEAGYIRDPMEVAEQLRRRYVTPEWSAKQAKKPVNEMLIFYDSHVEINRESRPLVDSSFDELTGSTTSWNYQVLAPDQVAYREGNCWCEACMHARGRSIMLSSGAELRSPDCPLADALPWHQIEVKQQRSVNRRTDAQILGKQLAKQLKPGGYFAVQARAEWSSTEETHLRPGLFWLAQAPDDSEFSVETVSRRCTIDGTVYGASNMKVAVGRYFDRDASDPSGLAFEEWSPPDYGASHYVNATELRAINFTMDAVGRALPLEHVRSMRGRRSGVVQAPPKPLPKRLLMPQQVDDSIRSRCW